MKRKETPRVQRSIQTTALYVGSTWAPESQTRNPFLPAFTGIRYRCKEGPIRSAHVCHKYSVDSSHQRRPLKASVSAFAPRLISLMMVSVQRMEHATDAQVEELVQLLTRAYAGITLVEMQTGAQKSIQEAWHRLGVRIGALEGRIWVVFDPPEAKKSSRHGSPTSEKPAIVSVLIAFGPGTMPLRTEAQRKLGQVEFEALLPDETKQWKKEVFQPLCFKMTTEGVGQDKALESWVPILLATDPEHRGRGYGALLVRELQRTANLDDTDIVMNTCSDESEAFFAKLGFQTKGKVEIPSPLGSWNHRVVIWEHESAS
ncbi:hypothetical protein NMY22_g13118 [Coprinellus aureogranulatus]|nr:hypothetical protein NMY22_g13118 [Coprinellus aureogranulatus]